jgi:hypothetical protein
MHLTLPKAVNAQNSGKLNVSPKALSNNPLVAQLMQSTLGHDCEQFLAGCIVALPGAISQ